jgi:hypothetical protein
MSLYELVFPKENVEILDMIQKYNVNINEHVLHGSLMKISNLLYLW